jgi:hypothetical protein
MMIEYETIQTNAIKQLSTDLFSSIQIYEPTPFSRSYEDPFDPVIPAPLRPSEVIQATFNYLGRDKPPIVTEEDRL